MAIHQNLNHQALVHQNLYLNKKSCSCSYSQYGLRTVKKSNGTTDGTCNGSTCKCIGLNTVLVNNCSSTTRKYCTCQKYKMVDEKYVKDTASRTGSCSGGSCVCPSVTGYELTHAAHANCISGR